MTFFSSLAEMGALFIAGTARKHLSACFLQCKVDTETSVIRCIVTGSQECKLAHPFKSVYMLGLVENALYLKWIGLLQTGTERKR